MRKKRKLYVVIALLAVAGLVLTSLTGLFTGLLAGNGDDSLQGYLRRYQQEVTSLEKELEKNPQDAQKMAELADLYSDMGELYFALEDSNKSILHFTKSLAAYQDAIELDKDNIDLKIKLANLSAFVIGDTATAEEAYKDAMALDPEHPAGLLYYGLLLHRLGNVAGAVELWETLLVLEGSFDPEKYPGLETSIFATAASFLEQVQAHEEAEEEAEEDEDDAEDEGESTP
jgi:cytochrome c-type biogenesis protein CcmH/NrfG